MTKARSKTDLLPGTLDLLILRMLERQGWVDATWKLTASKQRARFYRLTPAGRRGLTAERSRWRRVSDAIVRGWTGVDRTAPREGQAGALVH